MAVMCEDEQAGGVGAVNFAVWAFGFELSQAPRSDKPVFHALISTAILVAGQSRSRHTDKQRHRAQRK
jgi:hypothetical protein